MTDGVAPALTGLGNYRVKRTQEVAALNSLDGAVILCLGMRETGLRNITNPAGTDRGCFQISDLYHHEFLSRIPGCLTGSWVPEQHRVAAERGYVPRFEDGLQEAIRILHEGLAYAHDLKVGTSQVLAFGLASYNAGLGGAERGWKAGDVDRFTTGKDYSAWILERVGLVQAWLGAHPGWRP